MGDMHRKIMRHFGTGDHKDNLPVRVKHGGRDALAVFLGLHDFNKGVEIGVQWGKYSEKLCKANSNIKLYCVDSWIQNKERRSQRSNQLKFETATERLSKYNATIIRKKSMDAIKDFEDGSLDFIYIDANHEFDYVCSDIIYWSHKVRKGGFVACHDYIPARRMGVMKAVDAYTHCHHIDPWYVTYELMSTAFWVKP